VKTTSCHDGCAECPEKAANDAGFILERQFETRLGNSGTKLAAVPANTTVRPTERNFAMLHRYAHPLLAIGIVMLLGGCGFIAAPIAGTATVAAQLSVKGADQGIHYSKEAADAGVHYGKVAAIATVDAGKAAAEGVAAAANTVVEAAGIVTDAAISGLRPATSDEARAVHERFSDR